jgi:hypothetical protein
MRDTLRRIGVSESDFFRECDASFKQGSRFNGWVDGADDVFPSLRAAAGLWRSGPATQWQPSIPTCRSPTWSATSRTCACRAARPSRQTPEFAAVANYGYHLDAGKFGLFLRKHCRKARRALCAGPCGGINSHDNGDIASLQTQTARRARRRPVHRLHRHAVAAAGPALRCR